MKVTNFHAFKLILLVNKFANLTVPLPPSEVSFPVTKSDWITVAWNAPSPPHGIIIGYELRYWKTGSGNQTSTVEITKQLASQYQTKDISSLDGSISYSVQVMTYTMHQRCHLIYSILLDGSVKYIFSSLLFFLYINLFNCNS